jgi:hypothetical protein
MVLPYTVVASVVHPCKGVILIVCPYKEVFLVVHSYTMSEQMDLLCIVSDWMVPPCKVVEGTVAS